MAQERTISVRRRPMNVAESAGEADGEVVRWVPINVRQSGGLDQTNLGALDQANNEIIRAARGLLTRIVDLLK